MKILGLLLALVLATPAFAWEHDRPDFRGRDLSGDWEIVGHACSSGAFPWDQFQFGRDRYDLSFRGQNFQARYNIGFCQRFTEGFYSVNRGVLTFQVTRSSANCGPSDFGTFTYPLTNVRRGSFTVNVGQGPACPAGDLLQNTFERVR